ncbi:uracil-DNA glycosylase family protein [Pediococcus siamensis]|uniref:uracil-DNA glycosylase family protein n=1 Tax=Pediococcus siamensis TaxID=381829 RepID=UPI0039A134B0
MAIEKKVYDELFDLSKYDASWALYPEFDQKPDGMTEFQQNKLWQVINNQYMILALNPGKKIEKIPWVNFHSNVGTGARRLREVTKHSVLEGCYITDVYKKIYNAHSTKLQRFETTRDKVTASLPILERELELLHNPTIIGLGDGVEKFAKRYLTKYRYIKVFHYSYLGGKDIHMTDEKYYNQWWQNLENSGITRPSAGFQH